MLFRSSANKYLCADGTWKQVTQYIHPDSGITAGTYKSVTVNAQGHVTAGSNPTTLAGYGITDAAPLDHGIHVPSGGSNGTFLRGDLTWQAISGLGGIVAYSLNQNGYVKFGCGLILQWGYSTVGSGAWALKFNGVYTAVVVGAPGFPAREFCGFTFDYTLTGWSFTAGYNSPVS